MHVPLNAFSALDIDGLVLKDGASVPQQFHRGVVKPGSQVSIHHSVRRPEGIPPRPPSCLPLPGNHHIAVSLGEALGHGRVGSVHSVTLLTPGLDIPPLVIKVSNYKRSANMAEEAWYYEELEQLQGISIPRCYGFFQAQLKDGCNVLTWKIDSGDHSDSGEDDSTSSNSGEQVERELYHVDDGSTISVLLLERLGGPMPVGEPLHDIKTDVYELYNDLARLGIESLDIRWSNILSAAQELEGEDSAGCICPNHGHVHCWRLIDFDLARKTDGTLEFTDSCQQTWLRRLFRNLVEGPYTNDIVFQIWYEDMITLPNAQYHMPRSLLNYRNLDNYNGSRACDLRVYFVSHGCFPLRNQIIPVVVHESWPCPEGGARLKDDCKVLTWKVVDSDNESDEEDSDLDEEDNEKELPDDSKSIISVLLS
ncbi:hypothetical protein M422DRAFT_777137 [Sphaerobolus stellatus SS14]|nr:hypothetical protein M422DRAFT_777137 [Sphaerobolus stellatus SS14]